VFLPGIDKKILFPPGIGPGRMGDDGITDVTDGLAGINDVLRI